MATEPLICLAGSGGGHVRQLLDLEPAWSQLPHFFVTEPTALGESLAAEHPVEFVAHYAFGQTRLGNPLAMLRGAWRNLRETRAALRRRPDLVITTGAGAVFLTALLAKRQGAKVIAIESFARFDRPSLFGRMISPFADVQVVQSPALAKTYPKALLFDPYRALEGPRPAKQPLIFATVGATLAFPRLSQAVATLKRTGRITERVILQAGTGGRVPGDDPDDFVQVDTLPFDEVKLLLKQADIVITHAGTGSIVTALREGCHVIVLPRRFDRGEHYDDHQSQIADAFEARGLLQQADGAEDLATAIAATRARTPMMATTEPTALIAWLRDYIASGAWQR